LFFLPIGCSPENVNDVLGDDEDFIKAMKDDADGCKSDEVGIYSISKS
jgi:hypothetical protein